MLPNSVCHFKQINIIHFACSNLQTVEQVFNRSDFKNVIFIYFFNQLIYDKRTEIDA